MPTPARFFRSISSRNGFTANIITLPFPIVWPETEIDSGAASKFITLSADKSDEYVKYAEARVEEL